MHMIEYPLIYVDPIFIIVSTLTKGLTTVSCEQDSVPVLIYYLCNCIVYLMYIRLRHIERPYHWNNDKTYDEANHDQWSTCFYIVHKSIVTRC